MQSGLVLGFTDLVTGMVARFQRELGGGARVIATGGLADLIADQVDLFDAVNPDLTPHGSEDRAGAQLRRLTAPDPALFKVLSPPAGEGWSLPQT